MFTKTRLFTPGPTMIPEEVRFELAKETIHHRKDDFKKIFGSLSKKLKELFGTKNDVLVLTSSGTGAMQAAVSNLFSPKEKVLVIVGGKFGERWKEISYRFGLDVIELSVEWGKAVEVDKVKEVLDKHKDIKGVLIQASETSTGVLHPIKDIGKVLKDKDVLLIVDGISAIGISPCPMDKWNIDCLVGGGQKGFMIPPGLSMISLSDKAWEKAKSIKKRDFYFDLLGEREKQKNLQTLFTPAIALIRALNKALDILLKNGLEEVYRKHWALTCMVREGITRIGLEPMVKENYTWGLTSVLMPKGANGQDILNELKNRYNIVFAGGQGKLKGKIIRIGHMGNVDWIDLMGAIFALKDVIQDYVKLDVCADFMEKAIFAYKMALKIDSTTLLSLV